MTTGRDLNVASFTAGNALSLTGANGLALTAARNINLGIGNASQINVSGVALNAGNDISLNGGAHSVTLTPTSIAGTLIGGGAGNLAGSSVSVSATTGNYSVGALNSPEQLLSLIQITLPVTVAYRLSVHLPRPVPQSL